MVQWLSVHLCVVNQLVGKCVLFATGKELTGNVSTQIEYRTAYEHSDVFISVLLFSECFYTTYASRSKHHRSSMYLSQVHSFCSNFEAHRFGRTEAPWWLKETKPSSTVRPCTFFKRALRRWLPTCFPLRKLHLLLGSQHYCLALRLQVPPQKGIWTLRTHPKHLLRRWKNVVFRSRTRCDEVGKGHWLSSDYSLSINLWHVRHINL